MPTVPVARQQQELNPLPNQRATASATAAAFGGNDAAALARTGEAVSRTGDVFAAASERFRAREDAHAVRQAQLEFDRRTRELLNDPESGLYSRRGTRAKGVTQDALKSLDDFEREVLESLNDRQRAAFSERVASVKNSTLNSVSRYETDEFRRSEAETLDGLLNSSIDSALDAYRSPDLIDEHKKRGEAEIDQLAKLHGWSPELRQAKLDDFRSLLHKGVVERLLVDDPTGAREYFDEHQSEIDGGTELVLEKALKVGGVRRRSQEETDRIFAETSDVAEQRRLARAIDDPEIRDETLRRVNARHGEVEQQRAERQRELKSNVWQHLARGGSLDEVSPSTLSEIDGNTLASMQAYEDKQGEVETDWWLYTRLQTLDPRDLLNQDLNNYRGQLADSQYSQIVNLQRSYRDALSKANTSDLSSVGAVNTQLGAIADEAGLSGSENAEKKGRYMQRARELVFARMTELGRDLTPREITQTVAPLTYEVAVPGIVFDTDRQLFEVLGTEDEQKLRADVEDIPDEERLKIVDALKRAGRQVTDKNIESLWLKKVLRDAR